MRHNTLYGVLQRGWCITAFGIVRQCARIYYPRMVQNRTGFEVAKEEEAEKMTASERMRERWSGKRSRHAAVKERLLDTVGETKDGNREPT